VIPPLALLLLLVACGTETAAPVGNEPAPGVAPVARVADLARQASECAQRIEASSDSTARGSLSEEDRRAIEAEIGRLDRIMAGIRGALDEAGAEAQVWPAEVPNPGAAGPAGDR
jgi:hypothetical protein